MVESGVRLNGDVRCILGRIEFADDGFGKRSAPHVSDDAVILPVAPATGLGPPHGAGWNQRAPTE